MGRMLSCLCLALTVAAVYGACPHIISRADWGARAPTSVQNLPSQPVQYAIIHHAESNNCNDRASCQSLVKSYQNDHMDNHGWADIGYNFVIGGDGSIFAGRGWNRQDAHTLSYGSSSLSFCLTGNFMNVLPPKVQLDAVQSLIACGVEQGKLKAAYTLRGHRDQGSTDCPGTQLYNLIRTWLHY